MGRKNSGHKSLDPKNIRLTVFVLAAGFILAGLYLAKNHGRDYASDVLVREEDGKTSNVKLKAESEFGEEIIDMEILSKTYSDEEIEEMKKGFDAKLKKSILANNAAFNLINSDLNLAHEIEGFPFEIEYRIRPRGIFDSKGKLIANVDEKTDFEIEITVLLDEYEEKETIVGTIIPAHRSDSELFSYKLNNYLENENENSRNNKTIVLPSELDGVEIKWEKSESNKIPAIIAMTILIAGIILFKDKLSEGENEKNRREAIISEYPEFANKYALLVEAGLTHRQVVERLGEEYKKTKKNSPLYEEVYKAGTEVKGGCPLTEALDNMAVNCRIREITYFVSLVKRNIKKGGKDIASDIKKAAEESTKEKREIVRRKAETAGTRLLLPMVFLLMIVFVLIMVPAFDSFSF